MSSPLTNCPTCKADLKNAPVCRRCKTDLTQALRAAELAEKHGRSAARAYADNRFDAMLYHAMRSVSLRRSAHNSRLLACAAMLRGDYQLALNTWAMLDLRKSAANHTQFGAHSHPRSGSAI
jgi:hypothetical protein